MKFTLLFFMRLLREIHKSVYLRTLKTPIEQPGDKGSKEEVVVALGITHGIQQNLLCIP